MTMHRLRAFALGLTLVALLIGSAARGAQTESPIPCDSGFVELAYGDHTTGCSITTGGSQGFVFDGAAGDSVRLSGITHSYDLDLLVRIFDPDFVELTPTGCGAPYNGTCSFSPEFVLEKTGSYTLAVSDNGNDNGGSYTLGLERIPLSPHEMALPYDQTMTEGLSPQVDHDFFHFQGTAGTDVRLNLLSLSYDLDPRIEVFDPNGDPFDTKACGAPYNGTCSFQLDLIDLPASGTYRVVVSDGGVNNSGSYRLSLWCAFGDCEGAADGALLSYVTDVSGSVSPQTDAVPYRFHGIAGTTARLNLRSASYDFDPRVEVRDALGNVLVDGIPDGAGCSAPYNGTCSLSVDLPIQEDGPHTILVSDTGVDNTGSFNLGLHCLHGSCDSDADGITDEYVSVLTHGDLFDLSLSPPTDMDFFRFKGTPGTIVEISLVSFSYDLDPYFQIWDPAGTLIATGAGEGAGCGAPYNGTCSVVFPLPLPVMDGDYRLAVYDGGIDNAGSYRIGVRCVAGACADATPNLIADNCIEDPNGPAAPGPNGDVQRDPGGDGFGVVCDADYNDDGGVGASDFPMFLDAWLSTDPEKDHNSDGGVGASDFPTFIGSFGRPPGPSGLGCRPDGLCPAQQ